MFVSGASVSDDQLVGALVSQGMSEDRARQVVVSLPTYVKKDAPQDVAERFAQVFRNAGATVAVRPWPAVVEPEAAEPEAAALPALELAAPPPVRAPQRAFEPPDEHDGAGSPGAPAPAQTVSSPYPTFEAPEVHPLRRHLGKIIALGVLLVCGSYVHGCISVTSAISGFNGDLSGVEVPIENANARRETVTEEMVVWEVQALARRHGFELAAADIRVLEERIRVKETAPGRCAPDRLPDSMAFLSAVNKQRIFTSIQLCSAPRWIIGITVRTEVSRSLYSHDLEVTKYVLAYDYEGYDTGEDEVDPEPEPEPPVW